MGGRAGSTSTVLDPDEQRVFRALGVFVDGFDIDAVASVTGLDGRAATGHIQTLQAKSLVVRADKHKATRFRLLDTVKAYAEDRLVDAGESAEVRDRHFDHFYRVAMVHGRIIVGEFRVGLGLGADLANIASAFEWAAAAGRWTRAGELLQGASSVFDIELAWLDGLPLLERAIEACTPLDVDLAERLKALRVEWLMLILDPRLTDSLKELLDSPVPVVRAHAQAHAAFFVSLGAPFTHSLVAWAQAAIDRLPAEDSGPVIAVARDAYLSAARVLEAVVYGWPTAAGPEGLPPTNPTALATNPTALGVQACQRSWFWARQLSAASHSLPLVDMYAAGRSVTWGRGNRV